MHYGIMYKYSKLWCYYLIDILHLVNEKKTFYSFGNQAIDSIKFLWTHILHKPSHQVEAFPGPEKEQIIYYSFSRRRC